MATSGRLGPLLALSKVCPVIRSANQRSAPGCLPRSAADVGATAGSAGRMSDAGSARPRARSAVDGAPARQPRTRAEASDGGRPVRSGRTGRVLRRGGQPPRGAGGSGGPSPRMTMPFTFCLRVVTVCFYQDPVRLCRRGVFRGIRVGPVDTPIQALPGMRGVLTCDHERL